ncbi:MAG: BACON domain-containing protein [Tannerellaceae bacterium]|nr:BACON domain-containing protein [Tannerellaceae bacterium]
MQTNYPQGWKAEITDSGEGGWLKNVSPTSSTTNPEDEEKENLSFEVEENPDSDSREGIITISCGNQLSLDVKITQTTEEPVSLKIQVKDKNGEYIDLDDNKLLFHSGNHTNPITPRELKVTWTPASENLVVDFDRSFDWWGEANDIQTIYENGTADLTIVPARLINRPADTWCPVEEKEITIQVGGDASTRKTISVERRHYEVYIERDERYHLDGNEHYIKLYSNTTWIARFDTTTMSQELRDCIKIIGKNPPEGGDNVGDATNLDEAGEEIWFLLKTPTTGSINEEVIINVTYDELDDKVDKKYVFRAYYEDKKDDFIAGGDANCYALKPDGKKNTDTGKPGKPLRTIRTANKSRG